MHPSDIEMKLLEESIPFPSQGQVFESGDFVRARIAPGSFISGPAITARRV